MLLYILFAILLCLHALVVFLPKRFGKYVSYLNILCHLGYLAFELLTKVSLDLMVLLFVSSITFYVLLFYIKHEVEKKKKKGETNDL